MNQKKSLSLFFICIFTSFSYAVEVNLTPIQENFKISTTENKILIDVHSDRPLDINSEKLAKLLAKKYCPSELAKHTKSSRLALQVKNLRVERNFSFKDDYVTTFSIKNKGIDCKNFSVVEREITLAKIPIQHEQTTSSISKKDQDMFEEIIILENKREKVLENNRKKVVTLFKHPYLQGDKLHNGEKELDKGFNKSTEPNLIKESTECCASESDKNLNKLFKQLNKTNTFISRKYSDNY